MSTTRQCAPRRHRCPAPHCRIWVPLHRLACSDHWFALPASLRRELDRTYRQDRRGHLKAMTEAFHLLGAMPNPAPQPMAAASQPTPRADAHPRSAQLSLMEDAS